MPQIYDMGSRAEDFFALKNPTASAGFEPANLGTKGQHATPRPPKPKLKLYTSVNSSEPQKLSKFEAHLQHDLHGLIPGLLCCLSVGFKTFRYKHSII
jgi:hypothetical protein